MPTKSRFKGIAPFRAQIAATRAARERTRQLIAKGQWTRADERVDRARDYLMRVAGRHGAEALRGIANELQGAAFLEEGADVARAVGKIQVSTSEGLLEATGFLVHPGVVLTNQHVIRDRDEAAQATISFGYEFDRDRRPRAPTTFAFAPGRLAVFSPEVDGLDYALIALGGRLEGALDPASLGYCPLLNSPDRHLVGMPVNIIQHPQGRRKEIAVRENRLTHRTDNCLLYETDTEVGSSGAPVFNDEWDVVALHHYGEPFASLGESGAPSPGAAVNEGIRVSVIVEDLRARTDGLDASAAALLAEVLATGTREPASTRPRLRPPRPGESRLEQASSAGHRGEGDFRFVVPPRSYPVTVAVTLGAPDAAAVSSRAAGRPGPASVATRLSERKRLDTDYSNRKGFEERFISGFPVRLDPILKPHRTKLAKLEDGTSGPLLYQHFSVFMHATRRLALLTATNIDGDSYLSIDRKTGQIRDGAEGESWYKDHRIDARKTVTQEFYSAWSHYFDRGHLVRRTDPIFGDETTALRAHADTFHLTNCTPQHFRFNQHTDFWQGMERFILERGVLSPDANASRISVLQGPVFRSDDWIAEYEDDEGAQTLKVPGAFWKLALWKGASGKRALAMMASQAPLWDEERRSIARPDDEAPIQVDQFRVSVRELSLATGPVRVAEGRRLITSWDQMEF